MGDPVIVTARVDNGVFRRPFFSDRVVYFDGRMFFIFDLRKISLCVENERRSNNNVSLPDLAQFGSLDRIEYG